MGAAVRFFQNCLCFRLKKPSFPSFSWEVFLFPSSWCPPLNYLQFNSALQWAAPYSALCLRPNKCGVEENNSFSGSPGSALFLQSRLLLIPLLPGKPTGPCSALVPSRTLKGFSAQQLPKQSVPSLCCCRSFFFLPRWEALNLSLLIFFKFLLSHSSSMSWMLLNGRGVLEPTYYTP